MAGVFNNQRTSFASGEVTPSIRASNDLARYQTGAEKVEGLVVMIEAILTRAPGTRFIHELVDETQVGKMIPFRYSGSDYYMLGFNGGKMLVLKDLGFLESSPGVLFQLTVPFVEADMAKLRAAASGNAILIVTGNEPQKLTRLGHTNWTIEQFRPKNGPVDAQNLDTSITILASAVTGSGITLTGAGGPFKSGHVDGIFRLDEPSQSIVPLWQVSETITLSTEALASVSGNIGDVTTPANAFDANDATSTSKAAATFAYVGNSVSVASTILNARVLMATPAPTAHGSITLQLYGKTGAAPASSTDGTLLAQTGYDVDADGANFHTLTSTDTISTWDHIWVRAVYSGAATTIGFFTVTFTRLVAGSLPTLRRWQSNVYQALTSGNTGTNAPVHTSGDVAAGTGNVTWRYLHAGYGFVQITAFISANQVTGNVLSRIPDSVKATPTYRWWPPSWCDDVGWPDQVATYDQRAYFARDNIYWLTKSTTIDDFEVTINADSAVARRLVAPDGSFVELEWAIASGVLIQGSRDFEWITRAPGDNDALTVTNVVDIPDQHEGSAPQIPALVEKGAIFIGKSKQRLHYLKFTRLAQELSLAEISVASRHIFGVGATAMAWQRDPHRLLWIALADGTLAVCTFMPDEKIVGFTRRPMTNCFVEDLVSLPTADNGRSDVYLQTRRVINGVTRRYYELLMPFFEPLDATAPTAAGAWFVDCGLRYQGVATTTITGLSHLEGQVVGVLADGAEVLPRPTVTAGAITLATAASDVIVGIPSAYRFRDLPRDITVQGQSSKGKPKRASHMTVDVKDTAGGTARFNDGDTEPLSQTGTNDYGAAIPLFTGVVKVTLASESRDEGVTELAGDNILPATFLGITPLLEIDEGS